MLPAIEDNDILLVNKISRHFSKSVELQKLYIFICPSDPEKLICKRIIAKVINN